MLSNVYLPKKISTCPKKKVLYVLRLTWKKALNLQNTRSFENQVFVCDRLDNVMQSVTFPIMHQQKLII